MSLVNGLIVCVTGSSRGIGRATALAAAAHGAKGLILHYYGDHSTLSEILSLQVEIETQYRDCEMIAVPGDIAELDTSTKARPYTLPDYASKVTPE